MVTKYRVTHAPRSDPKNESKYITIDLLALDDKTLLNIFKGLFRERVMVESIPLEE